MKVDFTRVKLRRVEAVLAVVLLIAAGLKTQQLLSKSAPIIPGVLHYRALLALLIQAELLLAGWLFVGVFDRARVICASVCFCIFGAVASYEAVHAMPSCGCFGNVKVPPLITAVFDFSAVLALWVARPRKYDPVPPPSSQPQIAAAVSIALLASAALWAGYILKAKPADAGTSLSQPGSLVILEPADWPSKPFPLLDQIDGDDALRHGRWLIMLYHYDCDSCLLAIPEYQQAAAQSIGDSSRPRVAFVVMPPAAPPGQDPVADSPAYLHLKLNPDHDWFATTPVAALLIDGIVQSAADGEQATQSDPTLWSKSHP